MKTGLTAKVARRWRRISFATDHNSHARSAEREEYAKQVWPPAHAFDYTVERVKVARHLGATAPGNADG